SSSLSCASFANGSAQSKGRGRGSAMRLLGCGRRPSLSPIGGGLSTPTRPVRIDGRGGGEQGRRMRRITIMAIVAASLAATHVTAQPALEAEPERALRDVEGSHIAGNVPPPASFDRFLQRDLQAYFGRRGITKP